jgi:hypothetical protein
MVGSRQSLLSAMLNSAIDVIYRLIQNQAVNHYSIEKVNPTVIMPKATPVDFCLPDDRGRVAA